MSVSHSLQEKLHLLDSLVPDTDNIPETVKIIFLQRALQKNNDTKGRSVFLILFWRSKTDSTGKFTFEVYYDLLWNVAYQHDVNNAAGDRIPSTTPGADPPRDARDSGSARSHSTHLALAPQIDRKWSPTWILRRYQAIFP